MSDLTDESLRAQQHSKHVLSSTSTAALVACDSIDIQIKTLASRFLVQPGAVDIHATYHELEHSYTDLNELAEAEEEVHRQVPDGYD